MLPTFAFLAVVAIVTLFAVVCRDPPRVFTRAARRAAWREIAERDMRELAAHHAARMSREHRHCERWPCGKDGCSHETREGALMCRMLMEIERSETTNG